MIKLDTLVLFILFFLSGLSGLIYESAWSQQLSLIFGSTELAIAAVLASYMGGLALGASLIGIFINRIKNPVILYALFEIIIAISALLAPSLLELVSDVYGLLFTAPELMSISASHALVYVGGSFLVLMIPTTLMGATLPLLAKYVVQKEQKLGSTVGFLYAINTLGACGGALLSAFVLLPFLGLGQTIYVAVLINIVIFVVGLIYFKNKPIINGDTNKEGPKQQIFKNKWIFVVMFVSGSVSLAYEVLWARLLSHILGGSIYSFGVILFVFLLAISVGALLGSYICKQQNTIKSFSWVQFGIAISFFISMYYANLLPEIPLQRNYGSLSFVYESLLIGLLTLFPGALFIGMTFPLAIDICAINNRHSGVVSARVYAWNTVGAIVGSLLMGFYLLPSFGFAISSQILSIVSLFMAIIVMLFAFKWKTMVLMTACLGLLWFIPLKQPYQLLKYSVLGHKVQKGTIDFLGIGESATVVLLDQGGEMRLLTNGLPESAIQIKGSREGKYYLAHWLSMLPVLVNPSAKNMLIVGLGAGLTLKAVPQTIENIDVVELEQEVVNANKSLSEWRGIDPLRDPRLKLHINDARNALSHSTRKFDIIVSQPSHPWTAGSSSLYTKEFFALVKSKLQSNGVFIQWIGMRFIDTELLKSLLATLNQEFNFVELYQPLSSGGLIFVASNTPINISEAQFNLPHSQAKWQSLGINNVNQIRYSKRLGFQGSKAIANNSVLSTDYFNVLKLRSPKIIKKPLNRRQLNSILADYDPLIEVINTQAYAIAKKLIKEKDYKRLVLLTKHIKDKQTREVISTMLLDAKNKLANSQKLMNLLSTWQFNDTINEPQEHQQKFNQVIFYLLNRNLNTLVNREKMPRLQAFIEDVPLAKKLLTARRFLRLKKWKKVQAIEPLLASIASNNPAYEVAKKIRIQWMVNSQDSAQLKLALSLIDQELAIVKDFKLLINRAEIGLKLNNYDVVLGSLYELLTVVPKSNVNLRKIYFAKILDKVVDKAKRQDQYTDNMQHEVLKIKKLL